MDKVEQQRAHFEQVSRSYFESRQDASHQLLKRLMWERFFRDKSWLQQPDLRVLEPMCGFAEGKTIVERHLQPEIHYSGFDYSAELVERARRGQPGLDVRVANILDFDPGEAAGSTDLILLIGGLHHVYDAAAPALAKLRPALRPGGHFVSYEPTHDCKAVRWVRERVYRRNALFDDDTERGFALGELNGLFERAGFELVDQMYPGLLSYVLFYNPDAFPLLNRGGSAVVRAAFALDAPLLRSWPGRRLSFATLSLWRAC